MKPLCDLCNTRHESYQAHVFATNTATNRIATNTSATNKRTDGVDGVGGIPEVSGCVQGPVLPGVSGVREVGSDSRTANRRSRESYNAYQREYMRKRRA